MGRLRKTLSLTIILLVLCPGICGCPRDNRFPSFRESVEIYDPTTDTWSPGPDMPTPRAAAAARGLGGMIYVAGGRQGTHGVNPTLMRLDTSAGVWEIVRFLTIPKSHLAMVVIPPRVYILGGYGPGRYTPTIDVYDTAADILSHGPDMLEGRARFGAAVVGGRVYVFGGEGLPGPLDGVEVLDPAVGLWQARTRMPAPLGDLVAETDGTLVYVLDGSTGAVHLYDPLVDGWSPGPPMPVTGSHLSADVMGTEIFVVMTSDGDRRTLFSLETVSGTWSARSPRTRRLEVSNVAASGGQLYVLGGIFRRD